MKIIIFGGTGLIGSAILSSDWIKDYSVVVVTRNSSRRKQHEPVAFIPYEKDKIQSHCKGDYAILNFAGAGIGNRPWTKKRKALIRNSRIHVAKLISEMIEAADEKPGLVLQASAVGYYGYRGNERLTEDSMPGEGFLADVCRAWEDELKISKQEKTRLVFLRTGLVLSRKAGMLSILSLVFTSFLGGHLGDGNQWMPWIHIRDEVSSIRFLLQDPQARGPYNLVAPNPVKMKDLFKQLGVKLRRPSWLHIPSPIIRMIPGGFGKELLLTSQFVQPEKLINQGYQFEFKEFDQALNNLYPHE